MGYSHIGSCLYISEEGEIHQEPGFWFRFIDRWDGALKKKVLMQLKIMTWENILLLYDFFIEEARVSV